MSSPVEGAILVSSEVSLRGLKWSTLSTLVPALCCKFKMNHNVAGKVLIKRRVLTISFMSHMLTKRSWPLLTIDKCRILEIYGQNSCEVLSCLVNLTQLKTLHLIYSLLLSTLLFGTLQVWVGVIINPVQWFKLSNHHIHTIITIYLFEKSLWFYKGFKLLLRFLFNLQISGKLALSFLPLLWPCWQHNRFHCRIDSQLDCR